MGHMGDFGRIARRARRRTVPIALGGFVLGAVVGVIITNGDDVLARTLTIIGFGLSFGGLSGAASLLPTTFKLGPSIQSPARGLDRAERRALRRTVFSARPLGEPGSELARRAADWARGASLSLPIVLGQFLLLYAGIAGPQLPSLVRDDPWSAGIARGLVFLLAAMSIGITIVFRRQIRGARRYLEAVGNR
ncbi:hypothetical protein JOE58_000363 [Curtobacterium luteum]|nr:hypothetical protein [Curtobacterium luteum]MBM7801112.1 hypothetical protein [Curtobacterium luteum]NUU52479.1 hypothetical protein [Curtobacterium luteum]